MGIGPTQSAWKADILPLNYTRTNAEMQSQKIKSTFQCLTILPYRTIDVKKNERLSQFLYPLTPSKTEIALIPLHCPITYPTQRYKHMQSARFRTIWQFNSQTKHLRKLIVLQQSPIFKHRKCRAIKRTAITVLLQCYLGIFTPKKSFAKKIIRTPICFQGSYYLHMVDENVSQSLQDEVKEQSYKNGKAHCLVGFSMF